MITVEDKIKLFNKMVFKSVQQNLDDYKKELEDKKELEIKEIKKQAQKKADNYLEKFVNKALKEKEKTLIDVKKKNKEKLLSLKNELIQKVYDSILKKAGNFVYSESYINYYKKILTSLEDEITDFKKLNIYMIPKDYKNNNLKKEINEIFNKDVEFEKTDNKIIGGFVIYNKKMDIKIDITLKSIIKNNKDFIGNQVYKLLNQYGDFNE
ncbi:MAG: V-type ATP synthase subunit E [Bacillota bacterium]